MNHRQGTIWDYFYRDEGVRQAHEEMYGHEYETYLPIVVKGD